MNNETRGIIYKEASGAIASFNTNVVGDCRSVVDINPVQSGTGDPSPDNVRPISGHTSATVTRTGRNLIPKTHYTADGTYNGVSFSTNDDGSITVSRSSSATNNAVLYLFTGNYYIPKGTYTFSQRGFTLTDTNSNLQRRLHRWISRRREAQFPSDPRSR